MAGVKKVKDRHIQCVLATGKSTKFYMFEDTLNVFNFYTSNTLYILKKGQLGRLLKSILVLTSQKGSSTFYLFIFLMMKKMLIALLAPSVHTTVHYYFHPYSHKLNLFSYNHYYHCHYIYWDNQL